MRSLLFILLTVWCVNAFTITKQVNVLPESFIVEYSEIISSMEDACTETIMNANIEEYGDKYEILLKINVMCDYTNANSLLKLFYIKYINYFDDNKFNNVIDSITKNKFPQYELMWGIRFNNTTDPYIERILPYNTTLGNNNKSVFYHVIADLDTLTTIRTSFNGHSLDYMGADTVSNEFYYRIYTTHNDITNLFIHKTNSYNNSYIENSGKIYNLD